MTFLGQNKNFGALTENTGKCLKIRVLKVMSTGTYQEVNEIRSLDTGIDFVTGDIPVVWSFNNVAYTKLTYTPCTKDNHWYISCNSTGNQGGGPDIINFVILHI